MSTLIDECLDSLSSTVQMNIDSRDLKWKEELSNQLTDKSLLRLGGCLSLDRTELEGKAKSTLRKILQAIHVHSGCPIDRFCVSGSIGHQSDNAIDSVGFDVSVFVDCAAVHGESETDPAGHLECSVRSAEKVYESLKALISSTACYCDHFGLHFEMDGYQFHLAVTPSLGHKMHLQRKAVWDMIEEKDKENQLTQTDLDRLSIALHESTTSFMHLGDPDLHNLVKLARFWRASVLVEQGCGELSTLGVVLVMIRCIEDEKAVGMSVSSPSGRGVAQHPFPVKKVFMDFLRCLSSLDTQTISYQRFYEPDLIPERHLSRKPYILDPVNPWRNVVHGMTNEGLEWVKKSSLRCLKMCDMPGSTLEDVFIPQRAGRGA